jgi:ferrochelatase
MERVAVVLFNLGGPDSPDALRPFLFNLFSDPDIFRLPMGWLTQKPFASLVSRRRAPEAAHGYAAIGGASPLLANTRKQADALARTLEKDGNFEIHICMRYWHPRARAVVQQLKASGISRVILLPLYPQYSSTTSGSSYNEFQRECDRAHYRPQVSFVRQWYDQPDYLQAITDCLRREITHFPDPDPSKIEVLFSAHGLPRKLVEAGDPYETHIRATYEALCSRLNWPRTTLCYQSRVGPLEWLRPYTDDVIRQKARDGTRQMLVYPIAFVSDHIETLYELGQTYAQLAQGLGVTHYRVTPALNDQPLLIQGLRRLVLNGMVPETSSRQMSN